MMGARKSWLILLTVWLAGCSDFVSETPLIDARDAYIPFSGASFVFLNEVGPRAGGTLVVRGSQRLVERFVRGLTPEQRAQKYSLLKKQFNASDPWLAELTAGDVGATGRADRFQECVHEIHGVPVCVDDLQGSPGDVVLTHPWMLHATSPNAGDGPRIMLGKNIYTDPAVVNYG